jgi:hypothetical protein
VYLRARDPGYQWKPALIHQHMAFADEFAAIGRVSARVLASGKCRYACSVNASSIDLVVLPEPSQNRLVDTRPNAGSHPFVKATSTCHATAAGEFARRYSHGIPVLRTNRIPVRGRAIIDTWASAFRRSAMGRKVGCYKRPQVIGKKGVRLLSTRSGRFMSRD